MPNHPKMKKIKNKKKGETMPIILSLNITGKSEVLATFYTLSNDVYDNALMHCIVLSAE